MRSPGFGPWSDTKKKPIPSSERKRGEKTHQEMDKDFNIVDKNRSREKKKKRRREGKSI